MRHMTFLLAAATVLLSLGCAQRTYTYTPVEDDAYTRHVAEQRAARAAQRDLGLAYRRYDSGLLAELEARQRAYARMPDGTYAPAAIYHSSFSTGTYTTWPGVYDFHGPSIHGGFRHGNGNVHFHSGGGFRLHGHYHGNPSFHFNFGGFCP